MAWSNPSIWLDKISLLCGPLETERSWRLFRLPPNMESIEPRCLEVPGWHMQLLRYGVRDEKHPMPFFVGSSGLFCLSQVRFF